MVRRGRGGLGRGRAEGARSRQPLYRRTAIGTMRYAPRASFCAAVPAPGKQDLQACWELGALLAAEVAG